MRLTAGLGYLMFIYRTSKFVFSKTFPFLLMYLQDFDYVPLAYTLVCSLWILVLNWSGGLKC